MSTFHPGMDTGIPPESSSLPESNPPLVSPLAPPASLEKDARTWAMWCHLSALSGYIVPMGNILGPLIIWQLKKDQFQEVDRHGREALNFQLSVLIYLLGGGVVAVLLSFFCIGFLLIPALAAVGIAALVLSIIAGVKASEGQFYEYPLNLRLIK